MRLNRVIFDPRRLPHLALAMACAAILCTACGGGGGGSSDSSSGSSNAAPLSAQAAGGNQATPPGISASGVGSGVSVEFKTPDPASTQVAIANPAAPAAFQGVGVNLVGTTGLQFVPCVNKAGAAPCPPSGPNPTVSANAVRAAINLPFGASGSYTKSTDPNDPCPKFDLTKKGISYSHPDTTNSFFDTYAQTGFYSSSACQEPAQTINAAYGVDSAGVPHCSSTYAGACMMTDVTAKNLDWVQVYFATPLDLSDSAHIADLAAFEAAQLVYQTAYADPPKYVELRNEPDNDHVTPANYNQFVTAFNTVLPLLIQQRQGPLKKTSAQYTRLNTLASVQVVGPGLTAAYKLDYPGDGSSNAPKSLVGTLWFQADVGASAYKVAQTFFDTASTQKVLLSSHVYDEKHVLADGVTTMDALAGLKNLFRVRDTFQLTAPSPVMLTEMAESVEHDVQTTDYMKYCSDSVTKPTPTNACGAPGTKDINDGFLFGYPNCLAGTTQSVFNASDPTKIVDMCHNQAATLNRNIINYANQGVLSELVWSVIPTSTTTRHGLLSTMGKPTLMNGGTEPLFKAVSKLGYTTVYPASWTAPNATTTVDAVVVLSTATTTPPAAASPGAARVALANTDNVSRSYTLNFGTTPFAKFTQVSWASTIGGTNDQYAGTALETTGPVLTLPSGTTFGSDSRRLVITLPPRSAVTLDLKR